MEDGGEDGSGTPGHDDTHTHNDPDADTEKSLVEEEDGELDWSYCHGVGDFVADNGLGLLSSPP